MKHLVIGLGEVGTAIQKILECDGYDTKMPLTELIDKRYDVIHICYPYFIGFSDSVKHYQSRVLADLVIVHSSVPVGTCDAMGAVHSPIRGIHPHLEEGIRAFTKFFGGMSKDKVETACSIFSEKGIKSVPVIDARNTEALKLWDTTIYGLNILIEKAIRAYCERNLLDFKTVYTLANATYNEGYALLGHPEFSKYVLKDYPGPIGGHCVRENWDLLDDPLAAVAKDLHNRLTGS